MTREDERMRTMGLAGVALASGALAGVAGFVAGWMTRAISGEMRRAR